MNDVLHKRWYWVQALLLGVPTVGAGGWLAGFGISVLAPVSADTDSLLLVALLAWAVAGIVGLLSWMRLSVAYLSGGRARLRRVCLLYWPGLALGIVAAAVMLLVLLYLKVVEGDRSITAGYIFFGPLLLIPSLHLVWLRWICNADPSR